MEARDRIYSYVVKIDTGSVGYNRIIRAKSEKEALMRVLQKECFVCIYHIDIHQVADEEFDEYGEYKK
jgi:hypothetical protein